MRYTELIGSQADHIERKLIRPKYYPCPTCGKKGKRKRVINRRILHVSVLHRRSIIEADVGVYKARCPCRKYFRAQIPGVPYHGRYSYEVRNVVANGLIRDRMPYRLVIDKMREDHLLDLSVGYIHACFLWAHSKIDMETHWDFVLAHFSGILCIDEVHDSGRTILFATDPLRDFTVSFKLVEKNDQAHMNAFLHALKERGLEVEVVITDGSPLYKDSLQSYWKDIDHQLCIFHVIKEVNKLILDGVRDLKNRIKRQGNKGRKRRRGRPQKRAQAQRDFRQNMSKKTQAAFIWAHQYLIVRKEEELSDSEIDHLSTLFMIAPELLLFRSFNQDFYGLFEKTITKKMARYRRTRMQNHPLYQANMFLAQALKKLKKEPFENMIVFLESYHMVCTNNHVERNNRTFRMMQKTRYKRRKKHTIEKAIELLLYERMVHHPLYTDNFREAPRLYSDVAILKMAA